MAENPTSSSTIYTTLGAPSGAIGGSNGAQSGTESLMSTLIVPLNASLMAPPCHPPFPGLSKLFPGLSRSRRAVGPCERSRGRGGQTEQDGRPPGCHQPPVSAKNLLTNRPSSCDPVAGGVVVAEWLAHPSLLWPLPDGRASPTRGERR